MTRFELTDGRSLGARVASRDGATWFASNDELELLWSLDEEVEVVSDNSWFGNVGQLLDLFSSLRKLSNEEVEERFGEGRSESGLGFQLQMSSEGKMFLTR